MAAAAVNGPTSAFQLKAVYKQCSSNVESSSGGPQDGSIGPLRLGEAAGELPKVMFNGDSDKGISCNMQATCYHAEPSTNRKNVPASSTKQPITFCAGVGLADFDTVKARAFKQQLSRALTAETEGPDSPELTGQTWFSAAWTYHEDTLAPQVNKTSSGCDSHTSNAFLGRTAARKVLVVNSSCRTAAGVLQAAVN